MTRVKVDVAVGFSSDPLVAERIADRNYQLKIQRDPSILSQDVKFDAWPFLNRDTGAQMYGAKYYYWGENNSPVVENHPSVKKEKGKKAAA